MSKTELRDALKAEGKYDKTGNRSGTWGLAFDLYRKETGIKLCNCGGSYVRLKNWMNS